MSRPIKATIRRIASEIMHLPLTDAIMEDNTQLAKHLDAVITAVEAEFHMTLNRDEITREVKTFHDLIHYMRKYYH